MKKVTLGRVLARSFFLQAAWNYIGHQNLGYTSAIWPALEEIHGAGTPDLTRAAVRNLASFNTQPHLSGPIIGALLRAEEAGPSGGFSPERLDRFRLALTTAFAAIGDGFFWNGLLPALAVVGTFGALRGSLAGAVIFWIMFNMVHVVIRVGGFWQGYRRGLDVARALDRWQLPAVSFRIRYFTAGALGVLSAWILAPLIGSRPYNEIGLAGAATALLVSGGAWLIRHRLPVEVLWYGIPVGLSLGYALIGYTDG